MRIFRPHRATRGPHDSIGAEEAAKAIIRLGWSLSEFARQLDTSKGQVCRWLAGDRLPSIEWALRVQELLGVPVSAWTKAPKRKAARVKAGAQ